MNLSIFTLTKIYLTTLPTTFPVINPSNNIITVVIIFGNVIKKLFQRVINISCIAIVSPKTLFTSLLINLFGENGPKFSS